MPESFDPYYKWLGIPAHERPPTHYRLLGIPDFEDDVEVIRSAVEQRSLYLRTFQLSPRGPLAEKLLTQVSIAKVCLFDPQKKAAYDDELRARLMAQPTSLEDTLQLVPPPVRQVSTPTTATSSKIASLFTRLQGQGYLSNWVALGVGTASALVLVLWFILPRGGQRATQQVDSASAPTVASVQPIARASPAAEPPIQHPGVSAQREPNRPATVIPNAAADNSPAAGTAQSNQRGEVEHGASGGRAMQDHDQPEKSSGFQALGSNVSALTDKRLPAQIDGELSLPASGSPYEMVGPVTVAPQAVLYIERGTTILASATAVLTIGGRLVSYGDGEGFVMFRPAKPHQRWEAIVLKKGQRHVLERFDIRGADRGLDFLGFPEGNQGYLNRGNEAEIQDCILAENKIGARLNQETGDIKIWFRNCLITRNETVGIVGDSIGVGLDHCTVTSNGGPGVNMTYQGRCKINGCLFAENLIGIRSQIYETSVEIQRSNIFANQRYAVELNTEQDFSCGGNFWGTDDPTQIKALMNDGLKQPGKGFVVFKGFEREPISAAGCSLKLPEFPPPQPPPVNRVAAAQSGGTETAKEKRPSIPDPVEGEVRLTKKGGPYWLEDRVTVSDTATLFIELGTVILVEPGSALTVRGKLASYGDGDDFVEFRTAKPGSTWDKILLERGPKHLLERFHIREANQGLTLANGAVAEIRDCVFIDNGIGVKIGRHGDQDKSVLLQNCLIRGNKSHGVELYLSPARFERCTFADNGKMGIYLPYYGHPDIKACVITGNDIGLHTHLYETYVDLQGSNVFGNRQAAIEVRTKYDLRCQGNYWGAKTAQEIEAGFIDGRRTSEMGKVLYDDFKTEPFPDAGCSLKVPVEK